MCPKGASDATASAAATVTGHRVACPETAYGCAPGAHSSGARACPAHGRMSTWSTRGHEPSGSGPVQRCTSSPVDGSRIRMVYPRRSSSDCAASARVECHQMSAHAVSVPGSTTDRITTRSTARAFGSTIQARGDQRQYRVGTDDPGLHSAWMARCFESMNALADRVRWSLAALAVMMGLTAYAAADNLVFSLLITAAIGLTSFGAAHAAAAPPARRLGAGRSSGRLLDRGAIRRPRRGAAAVAHNVLRHRRGTGDHRSGRTWDRVAVAGAPRPVARTR